MSKIDRRELLDVLAKSARKSCPVLPTQDMKGFGTGKLVGRAEGVAILFLDMQHAGLLDEDEILTLNCLLSNRDKEEVLKEREEAKKLQESIEKFEEEGLQQEPTE